MIRNDILRRLRYALGLDDQTVIQIIALGQEPTAPVPTSEILAAWYLKEEEPSFEPMPAKALLAFLDGLILHYRGPRTDGPGAVVATTNLNNNTVLKKIRIALSLQEDDLLEIMKLAGFAVSKNELTALFRKPGQRNYVECMDQFLRNFLVGLALYRQQPKN